LLASAADLFGEIDGLVEVGNRDHLLLDTSGLDFVEARNGAFLGRWRLFPRVCCCLWWSWSLKVFVVRKVLSDTRLKLNLGQLRWREAV
jgi:hypothetical protein